MRTVFHLGIAAAFLSGASLALLISYLTPTRSVFVCFVAMVVAMVACVLTACAVVLHATRKERLKLDRVIDLTVDRMLQQRGLEVVPKR